MIQNYSDPKVTLKQQYTAVTVGTSATLGACVIGPNYRSLFSYKKNGDNVKLANAMTYSNALYSSGLTAVSTPQVIQDQVPVLKPAGVSILAMQAQVIYDGITNALTSGDLRRTHKTLSKVEFQNDYTILKIKYTDNTYGEFDNVDFLIPKVGDVISCLSSGPSYQFSVTGYIFNDSGVITGIRVQLDPSYPSGVSGIPSNYNPHTALFLRTLASVYVDSASVQVTNTNDGSTVAVLSAPLTEPLSLAGQDKVSYMIRKTGPVYMQYQGIDYQYVGKVGVIAATTDAQVQQVLGQIDPKNPLACAVACACAAAGSNFVYFTAVEDVSQVSDAQLDTQLTKVYTDALDLVIDNDAIHGIVPCTTNKAVLSNLLSKAIAASDEQIPHFKYLYTSVDIPQYSDADVYPHTAVTSQLIAQKVFSDKRGIITFADGPKHNGIAVPSYCVAAAVAGLRSASEPHAPLSNVVLPGIQVEDSKGFTSSDLKNLGANGFLRVGLNADGLTIIRRQLTSAAKDDVNYDEQSIVCNIDSICLNIKNSGRGYVGNTNISEELLSLLQVQLQDRLRSFSLYSDRLIGPQLLSWNIVNLEQHPVYKDRIYVTVQGQPPKPFNRFDITFRMI